MLSFSMITADRHLNELRDGLALIPGEDLGADAPERRLGEYVIRGLDCTACMPPGRHARPESAESPWAVGDWTYDE